MPKSQKRKYTPTPQTQSPTKLWPLNLFKREKVISNLIGDFQWLCSQQFTFPSSGVFVRQSIEHRAPLNLSKILRKSIGPPITTQWEWLKFYADKQHSMKTKIQKIRSIPAFVLTLSLAWFDPFSFETPRKSIEIAPIIRKSSAFRLCKDLTYQIKKYITTKELSLYYISNYFSTSPTLRTINEVHGAKVSLNEMNYTNWMHK